MEILNQLSSFKEQHQWRSLKKLDRLDGGKVMHQGVEMCSFISNDYLGIASHKSLYQSFLYQMQDDFIGFGSASSRLLEGHSSSFQVLEESVANTFQKEACLYMNSGYHANIGILSSIPQKEDLILSDKLNHASIVDGLKLSKAHFERFSHLNYEHLERLLLKSRDQYKEVYIISEALFSMDGDFCDLKKLVDLKKKFNCHLILDEAHSIGSIGQNGLGLSEKENLTNEVDIIIAPCGKALGGVGALVLLSQNWKDYLINTCRSFIYTTSLPPINAAWLAFTWQIINQQNELRKQLADITSYFLEQCEKLEIKTPSTSYIQPIIIGNNEACLALANTLQKEGFLVGAIRYPTVPKGTARLRISLTVNHTKDEIDRLLILIQPHIKLEKKHADQLAI